MGETIISGAIFGICALIMIGIGISQLKSKKPVGFYSGEKTPSEDEISDMYMWNKKHGMMWIVYGIIIILIWCCALLIGDGIWVLAGLLLPIIAMIWYHNRLVKEYRVK